MGTLLKYEFRRSRVIFLGIIGVTLLVELLYLVGWCFKLETPLLLGIIGGVVLAVIALLIALLTQRIGELKSGELDDLDQY